MQSIAIPIYLQFLYALVINSTIALIITFIGVGDGYLNALLLSQCIGLSALALYHFSHNLIAGRQYRLMSSVILGVAIGLLINWLINTLAFEETFVAINQDMMVSYSEELGNILFALIVCMIITYFCISQSKIIEFNNALQEEKIKSIDRDRQIVETQLRLLQAQIEPHFLFNTLSNIISLIDSEPGLAKNMLNHLNGYFRSTLKRSRQTFVTLDQEITIVRHYLEIYKVRMGRRLTYNINATNACLNVSFPPLLLQSLVENAIKHGIEPKKEGGVININIATDDTGYLDVEICDSGMGLGAGSVCGVGLDNTRERLMRLYAGKASFFIGENKMGGVTARIKIPCEAL